MAQTLDSQGGHRVFPTPSLKKYLAQFSCHSLRKFRIIKRNLELLYIVLMIQEASFQMSYGHNMFISIITAANLNFLEQIFFLKGQPSDFTSRSLKLLRLCSSKAIMSYALHVKHMP